MDIPQYHHPKALPYLFLTELWERFGFYITQGLLVLYMTGAFGLSDDKCYTISGIFTGLVYISPFVGGFLADRVLGFKAAITWGGLFLCLGYAIIALSSTILFLYVGLASIIVGNGMFKPNISSILGMQYEEDNPRRDSGFTIFYVGINIGSALSGVSGYVKNAFGWHVPFALAALGIIIGLATFFSGKTLMKDTQKIIARPLTFTCLFPLYCVIAIIGISSVFEINQLANWLLPIAGVILLVYLVFLTAQQQGEARSRLIILNTLIISSIIFWMLFFQIFISANLFVERLVDKQLWGMTLSTTVFYASEGVFIILLGPLFAWLWHSLSRHHRSPTHISKFVLGLLFAGLGFVVLSLSTFYPNSNGMIHPLWVFSSYLLITIGELLLSPIGLSAVTLFAPTRLVGMMMGLWFVALGFGGLFGGMIAKLASIPENVHLSSEKLAIYQSAFLNYAYLAFLFAVILFFVNMAFKRFKGELNVASTRG